MRHAQHLHGTLTDLRALPSDGAAVDLLAALSDSGNLSIVRFDDALSRFLSVRQLRLGPPGVARDLGRLVVDPRERRLALTRPGAAHVTVFHPVPGGAPGDFESAGTPVEYSKHVAMDAAFAPRAPDASALVVLVTNVAEAKIGSETKEGSATETRDAVDADDSKTSKGRRSKTSRRTTSTRMVASMTMLSPESDAAKVRAAIDSRLASTRTSETFDEGRRFAVHLRKSAYL